MEMGREHRWVRVLDGVLKGEAGGQGPEDREAG